MKIKLDLNAADLAELNNSETMSKVMARAHDMLDVIFAEKDNLIKCSITVDDKE